MKSLVAIIFLLLAPLNAQAQSQPCARSADGKWAFRDLVNLAQREGVAANLPPHISSEVQLGNSGLPITRFSIHIPQHDSFRAIDIVKPYPGVLLFIRLQRDFLFWRLGDRGELMGTFQISNNAWVGRIKDNRIDELKKLCEYFWYFVENPPQKAQ